MSGTQGLCGNFDERLERSSTTPRHIIYYILLLYAMLGIERDSFIITCLESNKTIKTKGGAKEHMERDSNRTRLVMVVSENLGIEVPGFPPSVGKSGRSPKTPSGWIGKGGLRTVNVMLS